MQQVYKLLSNVLHPAFLPVVGAGVYFYVLPLPFSLNQKYFLFFIVLGATFFVPILTLILLKFIGVVRTNDAETIEERKIPLVIMVVNYFFLAGALKDVWQVKELTILCYATSIGLMVIGLLLYVKIKASLHMLGLTALLGFSVVYGINYHYNIVLIALLTVLCGVLATARLQLRAHTIKEVVIGSFLGFLLPIVLNIFYKI